jgi:hypothetical protein
MGGLDWSFMNMMCRALYKAVCSAGLHLVGVVLGFGRDVG